MENVNKFGQKILVVLENLQYLCDVTTSYKHSTKRGIKYFFGNFFPPVVGQEELRDVVQYLNKNGLKISITFPICSNNPGESQYQKKYGNVENVPLGLIKGKNMEAIKTVIEKNINKLKGQSGVAKEEKAKKIKTFPKVILSSNKIICGNNTFVAKRGHKKVMSLLLENAREFRGSKLTKKGEIINRKVLEVQGGYKDEQAWRDALNKLRRKIEGSKIPMEIINEINNFYILEIKYPQKQ